MNFSASSSLHSGWTKDWIKFSEGPKRSTLKNRQHSNTTGLFLKLGLGRIQFQNFNLICFSFVILFGDPLMLCSQVTGWLEIGKSKKRWTITLIFVFLGRLFLKLFKKCRASIFLESSILLQNIYSFCGKVTTTATNSLTIYLPKFNQEWNQPSYFSWSHDTDHILQEFRGILMNARM